MTMDETPPAAKTRRSILATLAAAPVFGASLALPAHAGAGATGDETMETNLVNARYVAWRAALVELTEADRMHDDAINADDAATSLLYAARPKAPDMLRTLPGETVFEAIARTETEMKAWRAEEEDFRRNFGVDETDRRLALACDYACRAQRVALDVPSPDLSVLATKLEMVIESGGQEDHLAILLRDVRRMAAEAERMEPMLAAA